MHSRTTVSTIPAASSISDNGEAKRRYEWKTALKVGGNLIVSNSERDNGVLFHEIHMQLQCLPERQWTKSCELLLLQ